LLVESDEDSKGYSKNYKIVTLGRLYLTVYENSDHTVSCEKSGHTVRCASISVLVTLYYHHI